VKQFRGTGKTIPEIAKLLRVEAFVEGALLPALDGVCLSVNLVGAYPERHIWAQTYDCGEPELAGLQRRIARTVAEQARVVVTPQVEARLSISHTVNPDAYAAYLRGRASVRKSFLKADIDRALGYFEKAVALVPDFAPAYAEKAWRTASSACIATCHPGRLSRNRRRRPGKRSSSTLCWRKAMPNWGMGP